ncbi:MAG: cytochrome P450, partial [Pseudomonadota bacterium]
MPLDRSAAARRPMPGVVAPPEPLGLWQAWRAARRNVLEIIPQGAYERPALTGGFGKGWIMLADPAALERVLKTREAAYPKSAVTRRIMRPRRGENLVTATGETWRWQRRAMSAPFAPGALDASRPAMAAAGRAVADRMGRGAPGVVDVYPQMTAATADVIADIALSGREALDRKALTDTIDAFVERVARISLLDLLGAPGWVPRPGELLDGARARMDRKADAIIAARRAAGPSDPPDFLDLLIGARDPQTGRGLSEVDLR